jgi:hypothetical protein
MPAKTPLSVVKDKFGEKAKLVEALETLTGDALWLSRTNKDKGLKHVSNAKLLRLHATFSQVKEKFGTREKLIDAILELEKRAKDAEYKTKLSTWPVPRLFDAYKSLAKRLAPAETKAKAPPAKGAAKAAAGKAAPKGAEKAAPKAAEKAAPKAAKKAAAKKAK